MSTPSLLPPYEPSGDIVADKMTWRSLVRAARREVVSGWDPAARTAAGEALGSAGLRYLRRYGETMGRKDVAGMTVTAYEPMRTEPPVDGLTDALRAAGVRVLVPITLARPDLDWADLDDPDRKPLGATVMREVDLFFIPALAISADGVRLGQGGGYYDTTLPAARELAGGAAVVVVLHDHEVVPAVPADSHDLVVDAVLRPASGIVPITAIPPQGGLSGKV